MKKREMIVNVWNHGRVVYGAFTDEGPAEQAILVHEDSGGTIVLQQEDRNLTIHRRDVPLLVRALREVCDAAAKEEVESSPS